MAFNGEIVVVRGSVGGTEEHELVAEWPLKDGWRALHLDPGDDDKYDDEWLAETSAATGAPVLACWVLDGDVAHIRGVSGAGDWDAWLNPPSAARMIAQDVFDDVIADLAEEEDGLEAVDRLLATQSKEMLARLESEIPLAARKAAEWAAQAGYRVPADPIEDLLSARLEAVAHWGFFRLLYRLGLRETDLDPADPPHPSYSSQGLAI